MSVAVERQRLLPRAGWSGSAGLPGGESGVGLVVVRVLTPFWDEKGYSCNPDEPPLLRTEERISFA